MLAVDPRQVAGRLAELRDQISERTGGRAVEIVAVTKGFSADAMAATVAAGCHRVGENYAQELLAKVASLTGERPTIHFVGRLQSNKIRRLAAVTDVWESVDRPSLLEEIARRQPGATVLIQVNSTGEEHKGGCPAAEVEALAERARSLNLNLDGVMTVGPTDADPVRTRRAFDLTRRLMDELGLATCSMGMSDDLDAALDAGTTRVRLGTALFGRRP